MNFSEKVKYIRTANGLSQKQFANKLGLSRSYIAVIETGSAKASKLFVSCLSLTFNVSREWLTNDELGIEEYKGKSQKSPKMTPQELIDAYNQLSKPFQNALEEFINTLWTLEEEEKKSRKKQPKGCDKK